MIPSSSLLIFLSSVVVPAVRAQDPGLTALDLSVAQATEQAINRNPELLNALAELETARGALSVAQGVFEPTFTASYDHADTISQSFIQELNLFADVRSSSNNYNLGLSTFLPTGSLVNVAFFGQDQLSVSDVGELFGQESEASRSIFTSLTASVRQPLLQGFRTTYNLSDVRAAIRQRSSAEAAVLEQRQQLLADTANAYWNLYYQQRLIEISQETLDITREERRVVLARIEQGDLAPVERTRVEAAVLEAESNLLSAQSTSATAAETLLLLLGEDPARGLTISSVPDPVEPLDPDVQATINEALRQNAGLLQLRELEAIAEQQLRDARHSLLPELAGTASYSVFGRESDSFTGALQEMSSGDFRSWSLGAELSVPLGNRVDRGLYQQQLAALESATRTREAAERALAQQVQAQVRALRSARLQIQLAQANLQAAEATLEADRALRDAGRAIERDVLESIRDVETARVNLAKAQADYNLALIELSRLRGAL